MTTLELQKLILENTPSRRTLIEYVSQSKNIVKIGVYRNHSFELIEHTIGAYLDFADLQAVFSYSDYDDSLSFFNISDDIDMLILWLDVSRYKEVDINEFIESRIKILRQKFFKPVLLVPFGKEMEIKDSSIMVMNLNNIKNILGDRFLDLRLEEYSGTKLSAKSCMMISKELGLKYIPALLKPNLKAIILDLDNTLYKGVLGEDGINGIELTSGHKKLQQKLLSLSNKGLFLCVASKNEEKDVLDMFDKRTDFPLKKEDFAVIKASWDDKASSVEEIAKKLNIHHESFLFIDDNIGELNFMKMAYPSIKILHAKENAEITADMLDYYPGLLKQNVQNEDLLRNADIKANMDREALKQKFSAEDYIKSLKIQLSFSINNLENAQRVYELANKTNQFIFNYKRYSYAEIEDIMKSNDKAVITVSLSDKLSDSGIISGCVAIKEDENVIIDELFVSCRALGRGIEDIIVLGSILEATKHLNAKNVKVNFRKGERNVPAEMFVQKYLNGYTKKAQELKYEIPKGLVEIKKY